MLIKLICASIISIKVKRFSSFLFFQSMKQSRTYAFDFAIGIGGKKYNFTVGRIRFQVMCKLFFCGIFVETCSTFKKRFLYYINKADVNILQKTLLLPFFSFNFCQ